MDFRNVKWEYNTDQVTSSETNISWEKSDVSKYDNYTDVILTFRTDVADKTATVYYQLVDDKLVNAGYLWHSDFTTSRNFLNTTFYIKQILDDKYGPGEKLSHQLVYEGFHQGKYIWKTERSEIILFFRDGKLKDLVFPVEDGTYTLKTEYTWIGLSNFINGLNKKLRQKDPNSKDF